MNAGKKLLLAGIILMLLLSSALTQTAKPPPSPTPTPDPTGNLALNKAVTCSSQIVGFEAGKAVDGDLLTRWEASPFPQWIQVNLGTAATIGRTEIAPYLDRAYQYKIEISNNGKSYTLVVDKTANTQGGSVLADTFTPVSAKYIKLTVTGAYGYAGTYASVNEFRVFAPLPASPSPTPTPTPTVTPPPATPSPTPSNPPGKAGIWSSAAELATVPMEGPGWIEVLAAADLADPNAATVSNQDSDNNVQMLAAGIVYARTGIQSYKDKVVAACERLVQGGKPADRTLAWARETGAYAMAADLVGYRTPDFETWLRNMAEVYVASDGRTMRSMFEARPNNWGSMGFGSLCAIYRYLNDTANLRAVRDYWVQLVTGPKPAPASYGADLTWHVDPANPRFINPQGSVKQGLNIDGVIPDDMRRNGSFSNPPPAVSTDYHWEVQQGVIMAARILDRAGMSIYQVDNQAILRATQIFMDVWAPAFGSQWIPDGDDLWMLKFQDSAYGTNYSATHTDVWRKGKCAGWAYVTLAD